jgi:hypothetical protein
VQERAQSNEKDGKVTFQNGYVYKDTHPKKGDLGLVPLTDEWRIFYEEYGIAGTLDFLEYKNGVFTIYDWKRSEKLVKNGVILKDNPWGTSAFDPISHIPDTSFYHYALQLSMYRYILEQKYDIHVSQSRLGVFHPNNGTYHVGVDTNNLAPISLEQIWRECWPEKQMKQPEVKAYHDAHVNGTYDWDL